MYIIFIIFCQYNRQFLCIYTIVSRDFLIYFIFNNQRQKFSAYCRRERVTGENRKGGSRFPVKTAAVS